MMLLDNSLRFLCSLDWLRGKKHRVERGVGDGVEWKWKWTNSCISYLYLWFFVGNFPTNCKQRLQINKSSLNFLAAKPNS